ncbi:MAG: hypothetical protein ACI8PT_004398 [Gammaproteobacteria bacterium]|jgi:hypothetical protein
MNTTIGPGPNVLAQMRGRIWLVALEWAGNAWRVAGAFSASHMPGSVARWH